VVSLCHIRLCDLSNGWHHENHIQWYTQWMELTQKQKDKFFQKINKTDDCWLWTAATNEHGYGVVRINKRLFKAHRVSYEIHKGEIPEGLSLDHLCKNRSCVRPEHLEAVTHRENCLRGNGLPSMWAARRSMPRITHCKHGHEMTPENCYFIPSTGARCCRQCQKTWHEKWNKVRAERKRMS
jgi:hypothetical protein